MDVDWNIISYARTDVPPSHRTAYSYPPCPLAAAAACTCSAIQQNHTHFQSSDMAKVVLLNASRWDWDAQIDWGALADCGAALTRHDVRPHGAQ